MERGRDELVADPTNIDGFPEWAQEPISVMDPDTREDVALMLEQQLEGQKDHVAIAESLTRLYRIARQKNPDNSRLHFAHLRLIDAYAGEFFEEDDMPQLRYMVPEIFRVREKNN